MACAITKSSDRQQVRIQRSVMRKGLAIVGLVIRIEGPRLMRSQALWVEPENRILFYNSAGQRFATVKLAEAPRNGPIGCMIGMRSRTFHLIMLVVHEKQASWIKFA